MPQNKDARQVILVNADLGNYNRLMRQSTIESLLKAANSSTEGDTSVNVAKRIFLDDLECGAFFEETKSKLLDIDEWNKNSSATGYTLFNEFGDEIESEAIAVTRLIRIGLYGSGKYDWVRVISILDEPGEFVLQVKPSHDPTHKPLDTSSISHFFGPEAANNFCVKRAEKTVAFYVIGLNERQNTGFTDGLIESARNAAVANVGYYTGLQKAVWKQFCKNFVATDEEKGN